MKGDRSLGDWIDASIVIRVNAFIIFYIVLNFSSIFAAHGWPSDIRLQKTRDIIWS